MTADNVEDRAALAYQAASSVYSSSSLGTGLTAGAADGYVGAWPVVSAGLERLQGLPFQSGLAHARSIAARPITAPQTEACADGGSVTITVTDVNQDGAVSAGDSLRFDFAECNEDGVVMSGGLVVSGIANTEHADGYTISADYTFISANSRALAAGTPPVVLDGDMRVIARHRTTGQGSIEASLSGTRLTSATSGRPTAVMSQYHATFTVDLTTSQYRYSFNATVDDGVQPALTLATPTVWVGQGGDHPSSGTLTATGADGSAVRITAQSATTVEIGLDADGDGRYEQSFTRSWAQLARALNASPGVEHDPSLKLD